MVRRDWAVFCAISMLAMLETAPAFAAEEDAKRPDDTAEAKPTDDTARLDGGEILVVARPVPGSSLPEVTARAVIDAPPEKLWAILQDCGNYQKTMSRVASSKELSRQGNKVVCQVEIGLPFPLSNLTGVTEATHTIGPPKWVRAWKLISGDYDANTGSWTLTTWKDNPQRTLAVYKVHAVPKSSVPDAILRKAQKSALPAMMEHLRKITHK